MRVCGCFVTGTDTGVGKTRMAAAIVRSLAQEGLRVAAMKPVAAGAAATPDGLRNEDALALAAAANVAADYSLVNPYCLELAASPHLAARAAGVTIDPAVIRKRFDRLAEQADVVVVEGAGGWLAPIGEDTTMASVALALGLPVLVVVGLRLGCLNHTLLTVRAIAADGLAFAGWIANHVDPEFAQAAENVATLEDMLGIEPLAVVPFDPQRTALETLDGAAVSRLLAAVGVHRGTRAHDS